MKKFALFKKFQEEELPTTSTAPPPQAINERSALLNTNTNPASDPLSLIEKILGYFKIISLDFLNFITLTDIISLGSGIIIGTLITELVNSFVTDIISPPIGYLLGGSNLDQLFYVIHYSNPKRPDYKTVQEAISDGAVTLNFGNFLKTLMKFMLVSFVLFWLFKLIIVFNHNINKLKLDKDKDEVEDSQDEHQDGFDFLLSTFRCPFCNTKTLKKAIRCPQCTSILDYKNYNEVNEKLKIN